MARTSPAWQGPPNSAAPPPGWLSPPGWQPDPRWGPAPPGWSFWRTDDEPAAAVVIQPANSPGSTTAPVATSSLELRSASSCGGAATAEIEEQGRQLDPLLDDGVIDQDQAAYLRSVLFG